MGEAISNILSVLVAATPVSPSSPILGNVTLTSTAGLFHSDSIFDFPFFSICDYLFPTTFSLFEPNGSNQFLIKLFQPSFRSLGKYQHLTRFVVHQSAIIF
jgi:hypothetical protein